MIKAKCKVYVTGRDEPVLCEYTIAPAEPSVGINSPYIYEWSLGDLDAIEQDESNIESQIWDAYSKYCDECDEMHFEDYRPDTYSRFHPWR